MHRQTYLWRRCAIAAGAVLSLALGAAASAGQVFNLSNGTQSAQVEFNVVGGQLHITLTNTMTDNSGPQWLTGLFFNISGSPELTYDPSGLVGDMITLNGTTQTPYTDHDADQFWAYRDDISSGELPFADMEYGLGAAGFNVFGPSDMLVGGGPPPQPNGTDGGILADISGLSVPPGHEGRPFVLGSLTLVFDLPDGVDDVEVSGLVATVFGTGFDEVVILVPMPAALPFGIAGLAGLGLMRRRRRA